MSLSRILAIAVVAVLLFIAGMTIYNVVNTTAIAANNAGSVHDHRVGEWNAGGSYAGGNLDQHDRLAPRPFDTLYQQRQGEWQTGSNYANGLLDQHERRSK